MARYNFYGHTRPDGTKRIICVSSYAGKKVRGVAICAENDEFSEEKGMALAKARVDVEISRRRQLRAFQKLDEAEAALGAAERELDRMTVYSAEAGEQLEAANAALEEILKTM